MPRFLLPAIFWLLIWTSPTAFAQSPVHGSTTPRSATELPVSFTANRGQVTDTRGDLRPDILYTASSHDVSLFVRRNAISYVFARYARDPESRDGDAEHANARVLSEQYRMDVELVGANDAAEVLEERPAFGLRNYYLAHCPNGITGVPSFERITFREIYRSIDMVLYGTEDGVKCDFVVRPGGDPSSIKLRYVAADAVRIGHNGSVTATTPLGRVVEAAPVSFVDGRQEMRVATRYRLDGTELGFEVGEYDRRHTLTIDPVRRWATYFGGTPTENLTGGDPTEVDRGGNALCAGSVNGTGFPVTTGATQATYGGGGDAIILKFDGNGRLHWATYYGGNGDELAHGIVCDSSLNVFVAGHTQSSNFPTSSNAFQSSYGSGTRDAFVLKLDTGGIRQWATYYGGSNWDDGYGFAADSSGNVAVLVTTGSTGLQTSGKTAKPTTAGGYDLLIAKFTATGGRTWATYLGGNSTDYGYAVGTDTSQAIIVAGWSSSTNFPMLNAAQSTYGGSRDLIVAKYDKDGTLQWSTYYGGTGTECDASAFGGLGFCGVATDLPGNVFIGGFTTGNFPTTTGALQTTYGGGTRDAFVVKFNASGARQWATYYGGSADDVGSGVAARPDGSLLLTGFSSSTNLRTSADCNICRNSGQQDVIIVRLSAAGALQYGDYYGGSLDDQGHGISFDPFGSVIVAGITTSTNFPTQNAWQSTKSGGTDLFLMLFCDPSKPPIDTIGSVNLCAGDSVILESTEGYTNYLWNDPTRDTTRRLVVRSAGAYVLWARGANGCEAYSDTVRVTVNQPIRASIVPGPVIRFCQGDSALLDAGSGFSSYQWIPGGQTTRRLRVDSSGVFRVITIDRNGCRDTSDGVTVTMIPKPAPVTISPAGPVVICEGDPLTLTASGPGSDAYLWSDGRTGQSRSVTASGRYRVTATNASGCSASSNEVVVTVNPKPRPLLNLSPSSVFCDGDSVRLWVQVGFARYLWSTGDTGTVIVVKQSGDYSVTVWDTNGCSATVSQQVSMMEKPKPRLTVTGSRTVCEGDSVTLDATDGYERYEWSTGAMGRRLVVYEAGDYYVTAYGPYGCQGRSDTVTITVNPAPHADLTGPVVICANSTGTYSVPQSDTLQYEWTVSGSGARITSGDRTSSIVVQWGGSGTGTVTVRVIDAKTGCSATADLTVTVGNTLVPSISPSGTRIICAGESIVLDAGGGYSSYQWSSGETTRTIRVSQPGTYTVTVRNAQGCGGTSAPVRVTVNAPPTPMISLSGNRQLCPGDTLVLSTGQYARYEWSTGQRTRTISIAQPGLYSVVVYDSAGCRGASEQIMITLAPVPDISLNGPGSVCRNSTSTYCVDASAGTELVWTVTGGTIISGQGTTCVTVSWGAGVTGTVDLALRFAATGCLGAARRLPVAISTQLMPTISASGSLDLCAGDSVELAAQEGYARYEWSTGSNARTIRIGPGTYGLRVFDAGGCSGETSVTVTERPPVKPAITGGPMEFCEGDSAVFRAPAGFVRYEWWRDSDTAPFDSLAVLIVKATGSYRLRVVDDHGCAGFSDALPVAVHPNPPAPIVTRQGDLLVSSSATTYQWLANDVDIPGATAQTYRPTSTADHRVRITDENGCSAISEPVPGAAAVAVFSLPEIEAVPGERVLLPLDLVSSSSLDDVGAGDFTMSLRFNRTILFPTGTTPTGLIEGQDRVVTINGRRQSGQSSGRTLDLEFVAALGDTTSSSLHVENFSWNGVAVKTTVGDGKLTIKPQGGWRLYVAGGELQLLAPVPNPATDRTTIVFQTIEPGRTTLTMYDVLGRRTAILFDEDAQVGRMPLVFETIGYPTGTYFLVLETPSSRIATPLQIAH